MVSPFRRNLKNVKQTQKTLRIKDLILCFCKFLSRILYQKWDEEQVKIFKDKLQRLAKVVYVPKCNLESPSKNIAW